MWFNCESLYEINVRSKVHLAASGRADLSFIHEPRSVMSDVQASWGFAFYSFDIAL